MKKLFTLLLALVATTALWAHDFEVNGIYYKILTDKTNEVAVTFRGKWVSEYDEYSGSVTIPSTVTYSGKTYSVTSIGKSAFNECENLTSITIPNSVTEIGEYAFEDCSGLTSITIPNSVTEIGDRAFSDCSGLTSPVYNAHCFAFMPTSYKGAYTIPEGIKQIAGGAFDECKSLTSISIPNSVTSIGDYAFAWCSGLTSITIPNSVTSIGEWAFEVCISLTSVTIPNSVTSIGWGAFNGCLSLTSVTIPNSVTSIGDYAFTACSALTSVVVEEGNTVYDSRENCNAIIHTAANTLIAGCKNTIIPNSVTSIENSAFYLCTGLTSITIPNSVTSIGEWAFNACESLKEVICYAKKVPQMGEDVFDDTPQSEATLYVLADALEDYKAAKQWKEFGTILPIQETDNALENTHSPSPMANSQKVIRDGQLVILRDGKSYSVMGQEL